MSSIITIIGKRIRNYRIQGGLSQEKLAELSGCHPTYIGQVERGEKNATIESIAKISTALKISLSKLFENMEKTDDMSVNIPLECYEFLLSKSKTDQEQLFQILKEIDRYKNH